MTAFASQSGTAEGASWTWDIRSVNGRGLDLRLRLPDGLGDLETHARGAVAGAAARGNVTLTLKLLRDGDEATAVIDPAALDHVLDMLRAVQARATARDVVLAHPDAVAILTHRSVLRHDVTAADQEGLITALKTSLDDAVAAFAAMRAAEGASLADVLRAQLDQIDALVEQATGAAAARGDVVATNLRRALARVVEEGAPVDPDRLAQELALIAVKSDITEEIDRLRAHVDAARALIAGGGAVGRKLDFLSQEFNREANTLCAKAQDSALTRIGLDLKAVIDQMREQIQNVE